ncbi:methyltransferase [Longimonas halophila]|uniref:Methyltransferase n=1 Tax=Longimonas halophila TaxID=1469170 RepID=A0A2H3NM80_9BACT|nr:class I SAM-dependent methyltransferase [Longimonas halophila]PEN07738.1 methyltransferase [Longimonas halophila]
MPAKAPVELEGVPETLLLTLYNRAIESQRPDPILRDDLAVRMVEQIDYDFSQFGDGRITHPIRAKVFDDWARDILARHPDATIVNLGAGLSTMHARIDNGTARFVDLDLPEAIAVRRRFVEETDRHRMIAASALDPAWMDRIDSDHPVLFVAGGLLMYFEPDDVRRLLCTLADRFPRGAMAFDVIPTWFSQRSQKGAVGAGDYAFPPMPWALDYPRVPELETWHPRIEVVERRDYTQGFRGRWGLIGWLALMPPLRNRFMSTLVRIQFQANQQQAAS